MTVRELIAELEQMPQDVVVVFNAEDTEPIRGNEYNGIRDRAEIF